MDDTACASVERDTRSANEDLLFDIGFVGVGKLGLPMAEHLHRHGHRVSAFDASSERAALARAAGLPVLDTLEAVTDTAAILITSLPHDAAFEAVAGELATCVRPGQLYIDTSTVSTKVSARVAQVFAEAGIDYLRVTVSGNARMAEHAQLTTIASGPFALYQRVLPLLRLLGPSQFYVGEAEQARVMKLVINSMVANTVGMLAEALAIGKQGGLDWSDMWQVLCASAVASPIVKAKAQQLVSHDYSPTFTVDQMRKDVGLILQAGADSQTPLPITSVVAQALEHAAAFGLGSEDYAAMIKLSLRTARPQHDA
ncbi:NAD(P)-dependent oxidoreductase [Paraburkholderia sp. DHOC27]|uniref:NAD(P)-dependent oxidoreductase n=1 Tax=Paraburkholderia sp. DHOC27 TaxID=2303330 RepID=UPI000E3BF189|nr:NAD(P)-dependent oxidoreductase [Paraburkholderia sp. DHOC27]RFU44758.1 NAD(P)-dependent oxidoreductase [Paraburkholderia sp. DHOC27]